MYRESITGREIPEKCTNIEKIFWFGAITTKFKKVTSYDCTLLQIYLYRIEYAMYYVLRLYVYNFVAVTSCAKRTKNAIALGRDSFEIFLKIS